MEAGTAAQQARARRRSPTCRPAAQQARRRTSPCATSSTAPGIDVTFAEVGEIVSRDRPRPHRPRRAPPGERVASSARRAPSGPTPTSRSPRPAAVVVPIYPTNSPEECEWVVGNSESRRRRLRGRRAGREDRRGPRPPPAPARTSSSIDPSPATWPTARSSLDELRERGRARDAAELDARAAAVGRERRLHVHLHVGHHRAAQGLRAHARQLPLRARHGPAARRDRRLGRRRRLPLPAARPRLRAARSSSAPSTSGATIAYWGGDTKQIIPELCEVQPTYLPSVPRIFEKLYTLVTAPRRPASDRSQAATRSAPEVRRPARPRGEPVPAELQAALRPRRRGAVQERRARPSAAACARPSPARRRSPRRSSSSSTPAASRSWRATG